MMNDSMNRKIKKKMEGWEERVIAEDGGIKEWTVGEMKH